eukprot:CAMPEP_0174917292 /NCGR_PEP_ID=MMETSP1355-20121228/2364_1 /TAXON_ID=464990 /ORGANISM="Hemiselmis tepida, Strain CCMP443" /LENGTH=255 /DNA_ID=CAMNT_0016162367 /DNA_START=32 /DNA_END=799 /DNA_ORIENTATION=+
MSSYEGNVQGGRGRPESVLEAIFKPFVATVLRVIKDPSSPASKRALGIFLLVVLAAYFLLRKGKPSASNRGAISASASAEPAVTVKGEFDRIPVGKRVTVVANDTLVAQEDIAAAEGEASQGGELHLIGQALPSVCELARCCDLYVITQCGSDAVEERVREALGQAGVYDAGLNPRKVLFCGTEMGRASMARQLEPCLHIDTSAEVALSLRPFVQRVVGVRTPYNTSLESSSVLLADTFAHYFERARFKVPEGGA